MAKAFGHLTNQGLPGLSILEDQRPPANAGSPGGIENIIKLPGPVDTQVMEDARRGA
jgi:hypothetical protein